MALSENKVAALVLVRRFEEVVKANIVKQPMMQSYQCGHQALVFFGHAIQSSMRSNESPRMRASMVKSPGIFGSCAAGIVLM